MGSSEHQRPNYGELPERSGMKSQVLRQAAVNSQRPGVELDAQMVIAAVGRIDIAVGVRGREPVVNIRSVQYRNYGRCPAPVAESFSTTTVRAGAVALLSRIFDKTATSAQRRLSSNAA
jgi:hypothetical protein